MKTDFDIAAEWGSMANAEKAKAEKPIAELESKVKEMNWFVIFFFWIWFFTHLMNFLAWLIPQFL